MSTEPAAVHARKPFPFQPERLTIPRQKPQRKGEFGEKIGDNRVSMISRTLPVPLAATWLAAGAPPHGRGPKAGAPHLEEYLNETNPTRFVDYTLRG